MATALAKGFIQAGLVDSRNVLASDVSTAARAAFSKETKARVTASNQEVVAAAKTIILAVKPAHVSGVLADLRGAFSEDHLLLSIAAGVTLDKLEAALGQNVCAIRVMPNTPALAGASATAYALGTCAKPAHAALAEKLFSSVGLAFQVNESLLDAVTGLSGSGPAYVCLMIEALSDGGVAAGLPRDLATRLAAQTVLGSAKMVLESGLHPGVLKDMVASPGGTTIEGLHELEKGGVRGAFMNAVRAAAEKSRKLGQG